jgi:hypothetical protein
MNFKILILGTLLSLTGSLLIKYFYYPVFTESFLLSGIFLVIYSLIRNSPKKITIKYQHFDEDLVNFQDMIVTFELRKLMQSPKVNEIYNL